LIWIGPTAAESDFSECSTPDNFYENEIINWHLLPTDAVICRLILTQLFQGVSALNRRTLKSLQLLFKSAPPAKIVRICDKTAWGEDHNSSNRLTRSVFSFARFWKWLSISNLDILLFSIVACEGLLTEGVSLISSWSPEIGCAGPGTRALPVLQAGCASAGLKMQTGSRDYRQVGGVAGKQNCVDRNRKYKM
jgi:hypothetical protein